MASLVIPIANAVKAVLAGLAGAPATIEVRKTDSLLGRDVPPLVIVTTDDEEEAGALSGAGTATDLGDVRMAYKVGVTIYRNCLADIDTGLSTNPDYVRLAQEALNKTSLAGVTEVRDTKLVARPAWEKQPFGASFEKSMFGVIFYCWKTRLGNP